MILNAKELIELANDMDENCIGFAKWCFKNIKKSGKKFILKNDTTSVVLKEYKMSEILEMYKTFKFAEQIKK